MFLINDNTPPPPQKKYIYVVQCWKVKMQKETNEDWPSLTIWQSYDLQ